MNELTAWMLAFFRWCLTYYPPVFRCEYGEELNLVFELGLQDAAQKGRGELLRFCSRELRDIPGALIRAHVRERKVSMSLGNLDGFREEKPSGWKWGAYFFPFLVVMFLDLVILLIPRAGIGKSLVSIVSGVFVLLVAIVALAGVIKKLPGWTTPSLGFGLAVGNLVIMVSLLSLGLHPDYIPMLDPVLTANPAPYSLVSVWNAGLRGTLFVLPILLVSGIFVWLAGLIPAYQTLFLRLCRDWSQISLLIYLNCLLSPGIMFDPPAGSEPYKLVVYAVLAAGAWLYLRTAGAWKRLAVLAAAAWLAQSTVAAGGYFLYAAHGGGFADMLGWYFGQAQWVNVVGTLLPMAIPALLSLAPRPLQPVQARREAV